MIKTKIITVAVCMVMLAGVLSGCKHAAILPDSVAENIRSELGYALAPAYLPSDFKFDRSELSTEGDLASIKDDTYISIMYSSTAKQNALYLIHLSYPVTFYPEGDPRLIDLFELTRPDEAVSVVSVNGRDAYLVLGNWDTATLDDIASAATPADPQWDYDAAISVYFDFAVSAEESITVVLKANSYPSENWISQEEMIRIAESVVLAD